MRARPRPLFFLAWGLPLAWGIQTEVVGLADKLYLLRRKFGAGPWERFEILDA